jgi:hypothetical protein
MQFEVLEDNSKVQMQISAQMSAFWRKKYVGYR